MDEILTFEQIKGRYAPDWVLIGEPVTNESHQVLAGKVLFHSPDRVEVYRVATELKPGRFAVQFLGPIPEHMVLCL